MGSTTKLAFFLLLVLCFTSGQGTSHIEQCRKVSHQGVSRGSSEDWDILVLTQFWPPAGCVLLENGYDKCNITGLKSWVIHGLWPTKKGTEEPNFCNESSAFDPSKVQVLQPRLQLNWPTIKNGENPTVMWTHEWCKHGTCGTSLPALRDELHYFNTTLGLHDRLNLTEFLHSAGITPSEEKSYKYEDIVNALSQKAGSATPLLTCAKDKTNGKCYLEQVELCLTKSFDPTDCGRRTRDIAPKEKHDLLFQSEMSFVKGNLESSTCECESEDLYYKPFPSV